MGNILFLIQFFLRNKFFERKGLFSLGFEIRLKQNNREKGSTILISLGFVDIYFRKTLYLMHQTKCYEIHIYKQLGTREKLHTPFPI